MHIVLIVLNVLLVVFSVVYFSQTENYAAAAPLLNSLVTLGSLSVFDRRGYHIFSLIFNLAYTVLCGMLIAAVFSVRFGFEGVADHFVLFLVALVAFFILPIMNIIYLKTRKLPA